MDSTKSAPKNTPLATSTQKSVTKPAGKNTSPTTPVLAMPAVGRLYRPVDWLVFGLVTLFVLCGYLYTIAPDLTLEDSGELAVGSMYAGVPHPPGYPVWTVYSWLFTKLLPFSNIAWRVAVSSAVAAALAAGLTGLLISRGSSLILEGLDFGRELDERAQRMISVASGFVGGALLGYNGYIWSQGVIVEVYTLAVLNLMGVLAALMRYMWAPHQHRWLLLAWFLFGLCFCNHQTLIVGAMGIEVLVLMADKKVGRDLFLGNTLVWLVMLILHFYGKVGTFQDNPAIFFIFNLVGVGSAITALTYSVTTGSAFTRFHWGLLSGLCFLLGAAFYLYMPITSATNPPMNWGYPRTWEGLVHAFTRGQYEKTTPSTNPLIFFQQVWMYLEGCQEEFNWSMLLMALVPFFFLKAMRERERGWIIGITAIYACLAFLLLYLLNPQVDRQSRELVKVFFTTSHVCIALFVGYGLALTCALLLTRYQQYRLPIVIGAGVALFFNIYDVMETWRSSLFFINRTAAVLSLLVVLVFLTLVFLGVFQRRTQVGSLVMFAPLFLGIPLDSILSHWSDNEQRGHIFGYWFGHDMFEPGRDAGAPAPKGKDGKPIYEPMTPHAVLYGGTDPGRFCPTYMVFAESFTPPQHRRDEGFDRRDVYVITQNALADNTYLDYIRAHYHRSVQNDPSFFVSAFNDARSAARGRTNSLASFFRPLDRWIWNHGLEVEKVRRAGESLFRPDSFKDLTTLRSRILSAADPLSAFLKDRLGASINGKPAALARALNEIIEGPSLYDDPKRFAGVKLSQHVQLFAQQNPPTANRIRLNRLLLEEAYAGMIAPSKGGLYPDREIIIATPEDARHCFEEYTIDAQRRYSLDQLRPGEILTQLPDGRVSVSGQTAVMQINGLITKVMFDKNPNNDFYVEESFPLDWMYPHLTPYGIIMKVERNPVAALTDEQIARDHEYWSQYSSRFIGNWITYDTPVSEVCAFATNVYQLRNQEVIAKYGADPKFVRDDNAQKAFSKLRNAIGKSIYYWRGAISPAANYQKMIKEADFALKQAFAFCPYSPETVFNYASLLASTGHYADALQVVEACSSFDPNNPGIADLLRQLRGIAGGTAPMARPVSPVDAATAASAGASPAAIAEIAANITSAFNTASVWLQTGRSNEALQLLDAVLATPKVDARAILSVATAFQQLSRYDKMELAVQRYVELSPQLPEAWYDLAAIQALQGKKLPAQESLTKALTLSDARRKTDPAAKDLRAEWAKDARFNPVRTQLKAD